MFGLVWGFPLQFVIGLVVITYVGMWWANK
jgi:hypothetical protein